MFEKSLQDMVKGLRNAKGETAAFIAACVKEIKEELKSRDMTIKAQAVQKMTCVSGRPVVISSAPHAERMATSCSLLVAPKQPPHSPLSLSNSECS